MQNKFIFRTLLLVASLVSTQLMAQNGTIKGTVTDSRTGETVIGANVIFQGTTQGSATDVFGNYQINNVKPGNYTIEVSYISYKTKLIEDVKVAAGQTVTLAIQIEEDLQELNAVTVVGERKKNTEVAVLTQMKASIQVVNGVSAEMITRTQDRDASDVIKRIVGVTIVGDRFAVIRGLTGRYNTVMLNGVLAPSMETDVKSFSFDILPSSQIDQILVYKSPSADLPGEFGGGVIKVTTKSIPDENSLRLNYGLRYRQYATFNNFKEQERSFMSHLGFNDGFNDLPSWFPDNVNTVPEQQLPALGQSLRNNWVPQERMALPDQSLSLEGGFKKEFNRFTLGNVSALTYSNNYKINEIARQDFNSYDFDTQQSSVIYNFNDTRYENRVRVGLLSNFAVKMGDNHTIELKNLFNQTGTNEYIQRGGFHREFNYEPNNHSFDQSYRGLYTGQLGGTHFFNDSNTKLDWTLGLNKGFRDQPDYRRYRSDVDADSPNGSILYIPVGAAQAYFLGRFYSEMTEQSNIGAINFSHTFNLANENIKPKIQVGAYYEDKSREFRARNIGYARGNQFDFDLFSTTIDSLFMPENINATTGIRIDEQTNPNDSYSASNNLKAYYAMVSTPLGSKVSVSGGVRVEDNAQGMFSAERSGVAVNELLEKTSILPSASASYAFSDKMLLRAAYGQTLNRPEFRELAPFGFYDFNFNLVRIGNQFLKPATISNYDLRWEMYPTPSEIVSVGVFYKNFLNPIENSFVDGGGSGGIKSFNYVNAESANVYGVEVELRKNLTGLGSPMLDRFSVLYNMSLLKSEVELGILGLGNSNNRPLLDQSPYSINAGILYEDYDRGLQINLLYNVFGRRIFIIGTPDYPDIYEMPRNKLDFNITKRFGDRWSLRIMIEDIINQQVMLLQDGNQDGKFDRKNDQVIQSFRPGTSASFTLSYNLLR